MSPRSASAAPGRIRLASLTTARTVLANLPPSARLLRSLYSWVIFPFMGDEGRTRKRTGFAKDCKEFFLKVFIGFFLGIVGWLVGLAYAVPLPWFLWVGAGWFVMFWFAGKIQGSSRHAD